VIDSHPRLAPAERRLVTILQSLPRTELDGLVSRLSVRIDTAKRIEPAAQLARVLLSGADLREPGRLPGPSAQLLHAIAEAGGALELADLPSALGPLAARGLVYAQNGSTGGFLLILPTALLVQLAPWQGEDERGMRSLLARANAETQAAIAGNYLGRPATPPLALALEPAFEVLSSKKTLAAEITKLTPAEHRVLEAVLREGGEVDTEELLELEREPMRLRTAMGSMPSRRGVGFALERRGLLIPLHPNRHIVPTQVAELLSSQAESERQVRRSTLRSFVRESDHAPQRARFSFDPGFLAMGITLAVRESGTLVRPLVGAPKSLVQRLASRFGLELHAVSMIAALSRTLGLWDHAAAVNPGTLIGATSMGELGAELYRVWRRGGAWDEGRADPDVLRAPQESRDQSPAAVLRGTVIEALRDLGADRWIPLDALLGYLACDPKLPGVSRLLRRWAERMSCEAQSTDEIFRRIVRESMPTLGLLDIGVDGGTLSLRVTPRGRVLFEETPRPARTELGASEFEGAQILRVGPAALVCQVFALAPFAEVGRAQDALELIIAPTALAGAIAQGLDADSIAQRIEVLAPLPDVLRQSLAQANAVVGQASFVASAGFLWIDDPEIRELLRTRRGASDLFLDPSPPAGLLVQPGIDAERLVRRCRALGVLVSAPGGQLQATAAAPTKVRGRRRSIRA